MLKGGAATLAGEEFNVFSQTAEYALRAISLLAERHPESTKTGEIAEATRVPQPYLVKVLQSLARAGVVETRRGVGGGVSLARELDQVSILDVINAVDPIQRITKCPIGLAAHGVELCPMHSRLDAALAAIEKIFRETTLAEILADGKPGARCKFPRVKVKS